MPCSSSRLADPKVSPASGRFWPTCSGGRRVPAERVEAVARHYELFGGVSPLTAITRRQVDGLKARLGAVGVDVPVYLGMRNWHPLLPDVRRTMAQDGVRRAIGFVCAPHRRYSS